MVKKRVDSDPAEFGLLFARQDLDVGSIEFESALAQIIADAIQQHLRPFRMANTVNITTEHVIILILIVDPSTVKNPVKNLI